MTSKDSEIFHDLSPLLVRDVAKLPSGAPLCLALLEYVPTGQGVIFSVDYTHKELNFRTPGDRDAVAFGVATLEGDSDERDVRILFSQLNDTATMKGLALEGQVKPFP